MKQTFPALVAITLSLSGLSISHAWAQANGAAVNAPAPQVVVNNQPVQFNGQQPIEQGGRVLVPLRGVLEKMGAYVDFDAHANTVIAFRGSTRITLPIGATQATVNDKPVPLDVPAQVVNGSTLVPLRFVAQALGAQVGFDINTDTVNIAIAPLGNGAGNAAALAAGGASAADADRARAEADARQRDAGRRRGDDERKQQADAERQRLASANAVVGTAVAVYTDVAPRRIVVHVPPASGGGEGTDRTIPLRPDARIAVQLPNTPERSIGLDQINVGDLVSVLENGDGDAIAVNRIAPPVTPRNPPPVSDVFKGEFLDYSRNGDNYVLKMTDNRTIEVPRDVPVTYDSQRISADDLRSGDDLTISVDPHTHLGTRIIVAVEQ